MLDVVGFDLDSTLCDTTHRQKMIRRNDDTMDWDEYSMACSEDGPGPALPLAQLLTAIDFPFIVVSARGFVAMDKTVQWLTKYNVKPDMIFLEDDRHKTMALKHGGHGRWKAIKLAEVAEQYDLNVKFFIDDHSTVAEEIEKLGIPCMLVHSVGKLSEMLG